MLAILVAVVVFMTKGTQPDEVKSYSELVDLFQQQRVKSFHTRPGSAGSVIILEVRPEAEESAEEPSAQPAEEAAAEPTAGAEETAKDPADIISEALAPQAAETETDGEETLEFDGLILSFSPVAEGAAPCSGGIVLLEALADGYLSGWGRAGEYQTREILSPGGETVSVWFTKDDEPVYAEIRRGESTRLTLRLEHWEIKE